MNITVRCTHRVSNKPRCTAKATCIVQVGGGRMRPRCADHASDGRTVTPEEENAYVERRRVLSRERFAAGWMERR